MVGIEAGVDVEARSGVRRDAASTLFVGSEWLAVGQTSVRRCRTGRDVRAATRVGAWCPPSQNASTANAFDRRARRLATGPPVRLTRRLPTSGRSRLVRVSGRRRRASRAHLVQWFVQYPRTRIRARLSDDEYEHEHESFGLRAQARLRELRAADRSGRRPLVRSASQAGPAAHLLPQRTRLPRAANPSFLHVSSGTSCSTRPPRLST